MANMSIGSGKAPSSVWSGGNASKNGSSPDDNDTTYDGDEGPTIATRPPVNMTNHKRSPLS